MKRAGWREEVPVPLKRGEERFESWRRTREVRRIPEELWSEAVELAREHGVHRTARVLRLNVQTLRERSGSAKQTRGSRARSGAFVELSAMGMPAAPDCVVEVEDGRGGRMRIELRRGEAVDVGALARSFVRGKRCCK